MEERQCKWGYNIITSLLYPLLFSVGLFSAYLLIERDFSSMQTMAIIILSLNIILWGLEFLLPYNQDWKPGLQTVKLDLLHTVISTQLVAPLVKGCIILIIGHFIGGFGLNLWPHHWPIYLQVILAILIADLGLYFIHRTLHATQWGWKLHVVHHSPSKLHFWASSRSHPLNVLMTITCEMGPLLLLGINLETLTYWTIFMTFMGIMQHSNIHFKTDRLNQIFATADVHRVHHSNIWDYSNSNFGTTTVIWDRIFGTYCLPEQDIKQVGLKQFSIPENYVMHLIAPFVLRRFKVVESSQEKTN